VKFKGYAAGVPLQPKLPLAQAIDDMLLSCFSDSAFLDKLVFVSTKRFLIKVCEFF
jgi:hypothetical protein